MSAIQVWTSDGNWSEKVQGLDKLHLMKAAIICECKICFENYDGDWKDFRRVYDYGSTLYGISIDDKDVGVFQVIEDGWLVSFKRIREDLLNAKFFKMPLSTLRELAKEDECLSALYKRFIDYAKVPAGADEEYCLMFRFSEESINYCWKNSKGDGLEISDRLMSY